jgi:hypothetical protein
MAHLDQLLPYVNSPSRFGFALVAVVLVWIVFQRAQR